MNICSTGSVPVIYFNKPAQTVIDSAGSSDVIYKQHNRSLLKTR